MIRDLHILGMTVLASSLAGIAFAAEPTPATIATKMSVVTDDLNKSETGKPVQTTQKAIVQDLDALIASLEKECQNCKGNMKIKNPKQGMRDSIISNGPGGMGNLLNPGETGKDWGKLSTRERDRILQSMSEGFPPEYRTVLERYYRRLAEEKSGSAAKVKNAEIPKATEAKP